MCFTQAKKSPATSARDFLGISSLTRMMLPSGMSLSMANFEIIAKQFLEPRAVGLILKT
jgi:hypothetical protein